MPLLFLAGWLTALSPAGAGEALARRGWTVDGLTREALVYAPAKARREPAPVVFVFHGHGGNMRAAARSFSIHTRWPDAIVVYPQGLNTPGRLVDPKGRKPGWQAGLGVEGDRDLKFFDAMLASLQQDYRVDTRRVYATGHSNGGVFTYLLWAARGEKLAAVAPSAGAAPMLLMSLKPKPVLHVAGERDRLVKFEWQKQMMDGIRKLNQCEEGQPWGRGKFCTLYRSKIGAPLVTFIFPGGHQFHPGAPAAIVKFFQTQAAVRLRE